MVLVGTLSTDGCVDFLPLFETMSGLLVCESLLGCGRGPAAGSAVVVSVVGEGAVAVVVAFAVVAVRDEAWCVVHRCRRRCRAGCFRC